ncbi:HAD hydrolase family protein [Pseudoalteromonas sp. MMG005]|uniref:KdsC family phosphatase n=1 Tax=Pseudoalteromonas sp. MMG005 TaxID=2822682 RepID=UPI001B3A0628|nr:HAD hydrolase family protein [Pseudoalteromonas sp. MMG005]MBQ4847717.1 HAD hydrolase family protein [Pseudoalteromonas sp. MMG005]
MHPQATKIKIVILDIDGVMTNGQVGYGANNAIKFFDSKDDHMIRMTIREGLPVAIISGRNDQANRNHADELGISPCYFGEKVKLNAFNTLLNDLNLTAEQCVYIGDDVMDIPLLKRCGIGVAVADASDEAKQYADIISQNRGGHGAVREILVQLLKAQNRWDSAMARYLD